MSSDLVKSTVLAISEPHSDSSDHAQYGPQDKDYQLNCTREDDMSLNDKRQTEGEESQLTLMISENANSDSGIISPDSRSEFTPSITDDVFLLETPINSPSSILKLGKYSKPPKEDHVINETLLDSLSTTLSGLYAMLLVILGAVIQVSEPFTDKRRPYLFQGYYIYLYLVSIGFLLFLFFCILRKTHIHIPWQKNRKDSSNSGAHRNSFHENFSVDDSPHSHTGSFYLRLGAVAFGIGSMIKSGLVFGDYFESNVREFCKEAIYGIRPVTHFIFTFGQLYFVFLHSKVCVQTFKIVCRFGFMHMVATNLCVWVGNIVEETLAGINENRIMEHLLSENGSNSNNSTKLNSTSIYYSIHTMVKIPFRCNRERLIQQVVIQSASYLYPCSIEYSLICAGIIYIIWKNIGKKGISYDQDEAKAKAKRLNLDCTGSSRGLFLGILILVAVVITVIVFFVLSRSKENNAAVMVEYLSEIAIYVITSMAVIIAFYKMKSLRFTPGAGMDLEQNLIVVALAGIYIFSLLSIIAGAFVCGKTQSVLIIVSSVLRMFQATVQTIFMLNSVRRCAHLKYQEKQKPGREFVTFLLMANIAMWIINTFEVQQSGANPIQIDFYGVLSWNIFTHLSSPLAIFYRFHSTVCLSNIWKHAWKRKRA